MKLRMVFEDVEELLFGEREGEMPEEEDDPIVEFLVVLGVVSFDSKDLASLSELGAIGLESGIAIIDKGCAVGISKLEYEGRLSLIVDLFESFELEPRIPFRELPLDRFLDSQYLLLQVDLLRHVVDQ